VKEEFYNSLEQNINEIANSDSKIILGDFNAKVSKEDIYKPPEAMKIYIIKPTSTQ
jgi:exonuclease III